MAGKAEASVYALHCYGSPRSLSCDGVTEACESHLLPHPPKNCSALTQVRPDSPVDEDDAPTDADGFAGYISGQLEAVEGGNSTSLFKGSDRDSKPRIRKSETGLSCMSQNNLHQIRNLMHPKMRRSQTALSNMSQKTPDGNSSEVPAGLGLSIGGLRGHSTVSFHQELPVTEEYDFENHLGEGGFGQVFCAKQKSTGQYYAIKRIPAVSLKDIQRYEREIKVFERLSSCYVVRLLEIFKDSENLYLVMDLCTGGDLMDYLMTYWSDAAFPERTEMVAMFPDLHYVMPAKQVGHLIWQMLAGIAYLHHHRFLHRDVKLENYMLTTRQVDPSLQLCDFGLSVRLNKGEKVSGMVGTLLFMAPEVMDSRYDEKCDIWSAGVSAYIVATMCSPWGSSDDENEVKLRIIKNQREEWPKVERPKEMKTLIDLMLLTDQNRRPSAKDCYANSKWLRKHAPNAGKTKGNCSIT